MDKWNVGILVFDGVEVLDFAGPFEVFSRTRLVVRTVHEAGLTFLMNSPNDVASQAFDALRDRLPRLHAFATLSCGSSEP
jgi:putative intracellular protease/amidase